MCIRDRSDGTLGRADAPYSGPVALDGNLTESLLAQIASSPLFRAADLRVAPASPGKVKRLNALQDHPTATFYVNLTEAARLCGRSFDDSATAAQALCARGARRVVVTNGGAATADATADQVVTALPPQVAARRFTGAGDTFMASHIAAEVAGADRQTALNQAVQTAARYVSGDPQ